MYFAPIIILILRMALCGDWLIPLFALDIRLYARFACSATAPSQQKINRNCSMGRLQIITHTRSAQFTICGQKLIGGLQHFGHSKKTLPTSRVGSCEHVSQMLYGKCPLIFQQIGSQTDYRLWWMSRYWHWLMGGCSGRRCHGMAEARLGSRKNEKCSRSWHALAKLLAHFSSPSV